MNEDKRANAEKEVNFTEKLRQNPWMLSTIILGVLVLVFVAVNFNVSGKVTGNVAAGNLVKYLSTLPSVTSEITFVGVSEESGLYKVLIDYQDETIPIYTTKDGKYYTATLVPLVEETASSSQQETQTQQNIPKAEKPSIELYVFTYCPYGLQMEKAVIPAVKLLGDKISFKIRQIGAMHGEYEKVEAERQLCINKNYPTKFLDYVLAFAEDSTIGSCRGDATCLAPKLSALYSKLGIDSSKIDSCMKSEGETLYNAEVQNSGSKGISGSPTMLINGVDTQVSRSPSGVLTTICSAFNTAPSQCSQILSTSQASAGFGASSGSSTSSAASCG
jgi:hypothetical protein